MWYCEISLDSSPVKVCILGLINPYPTAFPYGNGMVLHFYTSTSNKRAAQPKLYTKSLTRDLKRMYSRLTLVRISINL